jgi:hypothetical protein
MAAVNAASAFAPPSIHSQALIPRLALILLLLGPLPAAAQDPGPEPTTERGEPCIRLLRSYTEWEMAGPRFFLSFENRCQHPVAVHATTVLGRVVSVTVPPRRTAKASCEGYGSRDWACDGFLGYRTSLPKAK